MKVIIDSSSDSCSGPCIHEEAWDYLQKNGYYPGQTLKEFNWEFFYMKHRTDDILIKLIENEDGHPACPRVSGPFRDLKVIEVPDDVEWYIVQNRFGEKVVEKHREWE